MNYKMSWTRLGWIAICLISGCSMNTQIKQEDSETAYPNKYDYPTRDRVEYVLNCIAQHGGLTYINQYACGCKIDKIAEKLSFEEYNAARTFNYLKNTAGEGGGVFRDPQRSKDLRAKLKDAEAYAEKSCFVK